MRCKKKRKEKADFWVVYSKQGQHVKKKGREGRDRGVHKKDEAK